MINKNETASRSSTGNLPHINSKEKTNLILENDNRKNIISKKGVNIIPINLNVKGKESDKAIGNKDKNSPKNMSPRISPLGSKKETLVEKKFEPKTSEKIYNNLQISMKSSSPKNNSGSPNTKKSPDSRYK